MRSHITVQPNKPRTKIIKRITVTQVSEAPAADIPMFQSKIFTNVQSPMNQSSQIPPVSIQPKIMPGNNQSSFTQEQVSMNQTGNSRIHHRNITIANPATANRSASRSCDRKSRIFRRVNQRFTQSRYTQDQNLNMSRQNSRNRLQQTPQSVISQAQSQSQFINQQSIVESHYQTQALNKPLESTRIGRVGNSRRSHTLQENLVIMPIQVFSYPSILPQICCKVKHSKY